MIFHFAPIQGHTDAPYRHFHNSEYSGIEYYYTPFIRLEQNNLRLRDIKDFTTDLNKGLNLIPQIIFRDKEELKTLVKLVKQQGASRIDLNMGCPFPLQTGHGRGASTVARPELGMAVEEVVKENPDIDFSVKMRLGLTSAKEWKILLPYLNRLTLDHIAVHPRVAKQQYGGDLHFNEFSDFLKESINPVVFNGEIKTPEDISDMIQKFPGISGLMIGRGILARPSLVTEYVEGAEWTQEKRVERMLEFHRTLLDYYAANLCGESQIISKIKPFWEYAENEIGRKPWKAIKKASNMAKYHSAIALI